MIQRNFSRPGRWLAQIRGWVDAIQSVLATNASLQAKNDVKYFRDMVATVEPYLEGGIRGKRVLDVGCGHRYPYALLLASSGAATVGIDLEYIIHRKDTWQLLRSVRFNGFLVTARTVAHICLGKYRQYYRELKQTADITLSHTNLQIERGDVTRMHFPDGSFDAVVSVAAFEHVPDIEAGAREICRVLKRGGIACLYIHCFPALSGGHHPDWGEPEVPQQRKVPPWDHLRGTHFPVPFYLNREREEAYVRAFSECLEVLEVFDVDPDEGRPFLTPEIRRELGEYDEDELVKRGIRILARRSVSSLEM